MFIFFVFHTKMTFLVSNETGLIERYKFYVIFDDHIRPFKSYSREFRGLCDARLSLNSSLLIAHICQATRKTPLVMGGCQGSEIPI